MKILNEAQIQQKIKRLAIEILENNIETPELILVGVNNNGMAFARMLMQAILPLTDKTITLTRVRLNPAAPLQDGILLEVPAEKLEGKNVLLIDDEQHIFAL